MPETLSEGALEKMAAPHKPLDHPAATPSLLTQADALVFAFPTRFGAMCAQMKHFWDATGDLWQNGALAGKPVTCVVSTGTQVRRPRAFVAFGRAQAGNPKSLLAPGLGCPGLRYTLALLSELR